ncbi:MAG TPA: hypothetical protein VIO94_00235 [Phenylobacterium sp.]
MAECGLDRFVQRVRRCWGPLSSPVVCECREALAALARTSCAEPWLAALKASRPLGEELYRDADHGFVLLAHTEPAGLYRPPHDHGRAWVVYAIQQGEIEMRTFARVAGDDGAVKLVQRDSTVLRAGQALAYLPGDIHDTRCLSETALLFRFTERDLRIEDRVEHRLSRYPEPDDAWEQVP